MAAIELKPSLEIVLQLRLDLDPRVTRQQVKAIVGCGDRDCLLQDLLPALVEPLQSASESKCQEQSHQGEHGTLDGI